MQEMIEMMIKVEMLKLQTEESLKVVRPFLTDEERQELVEIAEEGMTLESIPEIIAHVEKLRDAIEAYGEKYAAKSEEELKEHLRKLYPDHADEI